MNQKTSHYTDISTTRFVQIISPNLHAPQPPHPVIIQTSTQHAPTPRSTGTPQTGTTRTTDPSTVAVAITVSIMPLPTPIIPPSIPVFGSQIIPGVMGPDVNTILNLSGIITTLKTLWMAYATLLVGALPTLGMIPQVLPTAYPLQQPEEQGVTQYAIRDFSPQPPVLPEPNHPPHTKLRRFACIEGGLHMRRLLPAMFALLKAQAGTNTQS